MDIRSTDAPMLTVSLLGVECSWSRVPEGVAIRADEDLRAAIVVLTTQVRSILRRQKRLHVMPWDVLSGVQRRTFPPDQLASSDEAQLARGVVRDLSNGRLSRRVLHGLGEHPVIGSAFSGLVLPDEHRQSARWEREHLTRVGQDPMTGASVVLGAGARRTFYASFGALGAKHRIDWNRALLVASLVYARFTFEAAVESGVSSIRRCARKACSAFFSSRPMSGRQRFCCSACRASDRRERG